MSDLSNRLTTVDDIVAVVNAKEARKMLTETNYTVLSVENYSQPQTRYNSIVKVRVDLLEGTTLPVPESERYSIRRIPIYRLALKDAFKRAGLAMDKMGRFKVTTVADKDAFIASVKDKINLDPEEISFVKISDDISVVRAENMSLGFTGNITITILDENAPEFIASSVDVTGPTEIDNTHEGHFIFLIKDAAGTVGKPKSLNVSVDLAEHVESISAIDANSTDVTIKFKSVSVNTVVNVSVIADGVKGKFTTTLQAF